MEVIEGAVIAMPRLSPNRVYPNFETIFDRANSYAQATSCSFGSVKMAPRKIWVKRANASPTQVAVSPDDLVDDVRDAVIRKYQNSLGRSIDAPDVCLKICPREQTNKAGGEKTLGPDEPILRLIDAYYPGGQTLDEALLIDVPHKRTPKASPRYGPQLQSYFLPEAVEPSDYFSAMPTISSPRPSHHSSIPNFSSAHSNQSHLHSMSVVTTGQIPPLPSPGGRTGRHRPKPGRQHTSSPTALVGLQPGAPLLEHKSSTGSGAPPAPPLPTPPAQGNDPRKTGNTPPGRTASPPPNLRRKNGKRKGLPSVTDRKSGSRQRSNANVPHPHTTASAGLFEATVPPINVLIVEDNVINLKLLEAFMKRLKVRWKTAMDGKEAVAVWRTGGFHLVLMDIQLPVMNGLAATKEIRRLEALNNIGKLSNNSANGPKRGNINGISSESEASEEGMDSQDKLQDKASLFKSPVIIVALTASSLQSDRHEALAAGCNDFLTKPVNFVWMERKVTEWGCMQALIDFDGWRKWKDLAAREAAAKATPDAKADARAALKAMFAAPSRTTRKDRDREAKDAQGAGGSAAGQGGAATSTATTTLPARSKPHHHPHQPQHQHQQGNSTDASGSHARKSSSRSDSLEIVRLHGSGSSLEL